MRSVCSTPVAQRRLREVPIRLELMLLDIVDSAIYILNLKLLIFEIVDSLAKSFHLHCQARLEGEAHQVGIILLVVEIILKAVWS